MSRITIQDAFAAAVQQHQAGQSLAAEELYRKILEADPNHFDALQLLGLVCFQTKRYDEAFAVLDQAVKRVPSAWGPRCNLALTLLELNRFEDCAREAEAALAINPQATDALFCRAAVLYETGRAAESVPVWRRLLELNPTYASAWASLGATYEQLGRLDEAMAACRRAVELEPNDPEPLVNLGSVLAKGGRLKEAIELQRRAIELARDHMPAYLNLSFAAHHDNREDEAAAAARRAIELAPDNPDAHRNLAASLQELGYTDEARREALTAAELFHRRGQFGDADRGNNLRLNAATLLPVVYDSLDQMKRERQRFSDDVEALRRDGVRISVQSEQPTTIFTLAYHGQNDRDITRAVAELIASPPLPPTTATPVRGRKIRVGFISRFLRNHTIGRLNLGLIANLSRKRFDVTVLKVVDEDDHVVSALREAADRFVVVPPVLPRARQIILEQSLDVLFYTDIGMEPVTFSLAFSRLAPVQCVTWGHPVTSGISTIDYFISADAMEPPGSEDQYTERLVRLPTPAVHYYRPSLPPQPKTRSDFGLPSDATVYGCLQMFFKLHPEFDEWLADVLRRDSRAVILLLRGASDVWTDTLIARLRRTMGDLADRIRFIRQLPYGDFLTLTSLCDVMLDPIHFGGGNTTYEAFAFGVPVVTWPSGMARGRIAYALYKLMGIDDCIAGSREQYVELATSIATDPQRRRELSQKILAAHSVLFENSVGVRELEAFLAKAVETAAAPQP